MGGMTAIIAEFLAESGENLDSMDQDLVTLEKDPSNSEVNERIFRTIHTIKGTCGFLAFGKLEAVTHAGENVLALLRDGELELTANITTTLLEMVDGVREILAHIESDGTEGDADYSEVTRKLDSIVRDARSEKIASDPTSSSDGREDAESTPEDSPTAEELAERVTPETAKRDLDNATSQVSGDASSQTLADSSLRVDIAVLDELMNLVGELVLARNQITENLAGQPDSALVTSSQRLDSITGELQETVMRARMQPISSILTQLPRLVRDLAVGSSKEVEIEIRGQETDLDKSVLEAIKTSLIHLVRNAVDHGIEPPDRRQATGKSRTGHVVLRAAHEGGSVVIEVRDDGGGLAPEKIVKRAIEADLITPEEAAEASPALIEQLIFRPGFSTAAKVSNVSGRGVGLDVVRANVESIGGSIEMQSEPGKSTTFKITIPLTLAIVSVVLIHSAGQRFAIPQASVVELVRLGHGEELGIEHIHGVPVYRLRGRLLPLVSLSDELGLSPYSSGSESIVVLQGDDRQFGLLVDTIDDSQEIVVKPLGPKLAGLPFAGATILGDGSIAVILDVLRLGLAAGVVSDARIQTLSAESAPTASPPPGRARVLLLQGSDDERFALELSRIARLETVQLAEIERVGDNDVVQYRGEILQLVDLQRALPERRQSRRGDVPKTASDETPVIICSIDGQTFGMIVHRILDIVDADLKDSKPASREGVKACAVIDGRVNELIDLGAMIRLADPTFFDRAEDTGTVT